MADVKISDLTDGGEIQPGDLIEIERPGSPDVSRKVDIGAALSGGGGDPQTFQSIKIDTASTTSSSYADTGLSLTLPELPSADHGVLISVSLNVGFDSGAGTQPRFAAVLTDGSNNILASGDAASARTQALFGYGAIIASQAVSTISASVLWYPGSVGPHTIKARWALLVGNTLFLNRSTTDADFSSYARMASTLVATIVAPAP